MSGMKDLFGDTLYEQRRPPRLQEARLQRDIGVARASNHADHLSPGWKDDAFDFLIKFARYHECFISEDVSNASKESDFVQPPTDRAWGSVYLRAIKEGIITRDGVGRSARRHASICPRWRSNIFNI